jgi:hypothetical protein
MRREVERVSNDNQVCVDIKPGISYGCVSHNPITIMITKHDQAFLPELRQAIMIMN